MKKKLSILIVSIITIIATCFSLVGCSNEPTVVAKIAVPDGAPALSVTNIVKDGLNLPKDETFRLDIKSPATIKDEVAGKKVDIAVLPTNVAYKLFIDSVNASDNDPYVMVATATYGNLYIVSKTQNATLNDMVGNVLYSIGQNAIPHKVLAKIAEFNNLPLNIITKEEDAVSNKVNVIFKKEGSDVSSAVALNDESKFKAFGVLGEPAVTASVAKKGLIKNFDMQALYKIATASTEYGYPQAVVIMKKSFIENNKNLASTFVKKMVANMDFINVAENKQINPETKKNVIMETLQNNKYGQKSALPFLPPAIKGCNILVKSSNNAKADTTLLLNNIGMKVVKDEFFYDLQF